MLKLFSLGHVREVKPSPRPTPKGKRTEPRVPITSPDFKYVSSVETDLRKKWFTKD
jgi:hypothetical protein